MKSFLHLQLGRIVQRDCMARGQPIYFMTVIVEEIQNLVIWNIFLWFNFLSNSFSDLASVSIYYQDSKSEFFNSGNVHLAIWKDSPEEIYDKSVSVRQLSLRVRLAEEQSSKLRNEREELKIQKEKLSQELDENKKLLQSTRSEFQSQIENLEKQLRDAKYQVKTIKLLVFRIFKTNSNYVIKKSV